MPDPTTPRTPGEVQEAVKRELQESSEALKALLSGKFHIEEVLELVSEVVELIEELSPAHMTGEQKHAIAEGIYSWVDERFNIEQVIFEKIDQVLGWLKWLPFGLKGRIVSVVVGFIIKAIVAAFNASIWKDK